MRHILTSVRCDQCFESNDEFETDEEQLEGGWLILQKGDKEYDFCDGSCLAQWLESEGFS